MNLIFKDENILTAPINTKHVSCVRNLFSDRNTETQIAKRIDKLKLKFKKEGREFDESLAMKKNKKTHYYVNITSKTNGHIFRLNIRNEIKTKQKKGEFSSYGLSINGSTLPLF